MLGSIGDELAFNAVQRRCVSEAEALGRPGADTTAEVGADEWTRAGDSLRADTTFED